jgi:hypothetical protein
MNTITLRYMSDTIAKSEKRPEEKIFNQLKGLAARDILASVPDLYGKKGALMFPRDEIYRARMLIAALDNGFSADVLAKLDAQMLATSTYLHPDSSETRSLTQAVESLSADQPAFWVFEVAQLRMESGEIDFSGRWVVNGNRFATHPDWLTIQDDGSAFAGMLEVVTFFAFSYLCRPIFNEIERRAKAES